MNNTGKLNECLACKFGTYSESEFYVARLTGKEFKFICTIPEMENEINNPPELTATEIARWTNNCDYYEPRTES